MDEKVVPEGVQAVLDEAQLDEVRDFVDSHPIQAAPDEVQEVKPPKVSKLDQKRQQIFADRVRRKIGQGMTEQNAVQAVLREDFDRMPLDKKFARLEALVVNSIRSISQDIMGLKQNDSAIADAFDINYKAIERAFAKLGLSEEVQKELINQARDEVMADRQKAIQDQLAAQRKAQEDAERASVEAELQKAEQKPLEAAKDSVPPEGTDPHVSEGATVFGS